jgi:RNA-binding protein PNO1
MKCPPLLWEQHKVSRFSLAIPSRVSLTIPSLDDDDILIDPQTAIPDDASPTVQADDTSMQIDEEGRPVFAPAKDSITAYRLETRKVPVPPHRMTPLKNSWPKIYPPLVEHLKLQVRMNVKNRAVELRTSKFTTDSGALQKGEDFVKAFTLG